MLGNYGNVWQFLFIYVSFVNRKAHNHYLTDKSRYLEIKLQKLKIKKLLKNFSRKLCRPGGRKLYMY